MKWQLPRDSNVCRETAGFLKYTHNCSHLLLSSTHLHLVWAAHVDIWTYLQAETIETCNRFAFPQFTCSSGIYSCFLQRAPTAIKPSSHPLVLHPSVWTFSCNIYRCSSASLSTPPPSTSSPPVSLLDEEACRHAGNVIVMQSDSPRPLNIAGGGSWWCGSLLRRHQWTDREKCVLPEMMKETASPPRLKLTRYRLTIPFLIKRKLPSNIRISLLWLKFESIHVVISA